MKRILITGKDSYIGTSFKKYLEQYPDDYHDYIWSINCSISVKER